MLLGCYSFFQRPEVQALMEPEKAKPNTQKPVLFSALSTKDSEPKNPENQNKSVKPQRR